MTVEFGGVKKICARVMVVGMVAFGASACSSVPDWVDPTNWFGDGPGDNERAAGETPDLASMPDRPAPASTSDEQQQVAQSLAADRATAKYSADALRGGTEAAAAPPPPPSAQTSNDVAPPPASSSAAPAPTPTAAAAVPSLAPSNETVASNEPAPSNAATSGDLTSNGEVNTIPPPAPEANASPPAATADSSFQVAPPPGATQLPPAAPSPSNTMAAASPPPTSSMTMVSPSDAALGFKPSMAPPLDANIGQFVSPPLIARYAQTAGQSGTMPTRMATEMSAPVHSKRGVGGPESMSGAVVANLDALQAPSQATTYSAMQGGQPASVVLFPGDGTLLNASAKAQVRAAVEAFKAAGGQGFVRIVGHASSRTSNMPLEKHLEVIFNKSQDRANAVAKEVIREGVPANRVLVEAVGDSQPVYYESMPQGEDGNRRAEIYLQS
jgi:outer membrane protein OmpA-like peptidoglycan-associated protein